MQLADHPTVKRFETRRSDAMVPTRHGKIDADWLRRVCLMAGADDVGFVSMERAELDDQREDIQDAFPFAGP